MRKAFFAEYFNPRYLKIVQFDGLPLAIMKRQNDKSRMRLTGFIIALSFLATTGFAGEPTTNAVVALGAKRVLKIEPCAMKVAGGKATLTIGLLHRTNDVCRGDFRMKVVPYFFKNEKGTLAISVTDEIIAKAAQGQTVDITGKATAEKSGVVRDITAIATPADAEHGALKLWFTVDERKMIFETEYRFVAE